MSDSFGQLLQLAKSRVREKQALVDAATLAGGGDPAAMGGDPAMGGGDPAAMGGDPAAMGGDPAAMGGAPPAPAGPSHEEVQMMIQQAVGAGGGAMGGAEPIKPKIDINVEVMKMNKMLARIADSLGVQMPAAEMVATQDDLTQMGMGQQTAGGGAAAGGAPQSAIGAIEPMAGASPAMAQGGGGGMAPKAAQEMIDGGTPYEPPAGFEQVRNKAAALAALMSARS